MDSEVVDLEMVLREDSMTVQVGEVVVVLEVALVPGGSHRVVEEASEEISTEVGLGEISVVASGVTLIEAALGVTSVAALEAASDLTSMMVHQDLDSEEVSEAEEVLDPVDLLPDLQDGEILMVGQTTGDRLVLAVQWTVLHVGWVQGAQGLWVLPVVWVVRDQCLVEGVVVPLILVLIYLVMCGLKPPQRKARFITTMPRQELHSGIDQRGLMLKFLHRMKLNICKERCLKVRDLEVQWDRAVLWAMVVLWDLEVQWVQVDQWVVRQA